MFWSDQLNKKKLPTISGYTYHVITDSGDDNIIVKLGTISIINHIKMLLWDRDKRSYSYHIETSLDLINWTRVTDYTEYDCRSWQILHFSSQFVRYIKVAGTYGTHMNSYFHAVALEAYHTAKVPTLLNGLISPTYNVATTSNGAAVIAGQTNPHPDGDPHQMLNSHVQKYNNTSGYTFHMIGNEIVTVLCNFAVNFCRL